MDLYLLIDDDWLKLLSNLLSTYPMTVIVSVLHIVDIHRPDSRVLFCHRYRRDPTNDQSCFERSFFD
jgi:hypothetical protein